MSLGAGLSTMLGALLVFFVKKDNRKVLAISLGFAAGVMLSVSLADLLQNAQKLLGDYYSARIGTLLAVLFLALGIVLAAGLDKFVPHEKFDKQKGEKPHKNPLIDTHTKEEVKNQGLFRTGFVSMLAIALHNFPEGIATFMAGYGDMRLGLSIAIAIALHNIPEGISVAMPIYYASGSKKKAFWYTFLSGISEPIGAVLAFLILRPFMNDAILGALFGFVGGIMIYIAIEEMIPSSRQHGHNKEAIIATFIGICLMPITQAI